MRKSLACGFALGALFCTPVSAQTVPAAPEACEAGSVAAEEEAMLPAVRKYMIRTVAALMRAQADMMEDPESEDSFVAAFESGHRAVESIPTDELPPDFQAYIKKSAEISRSFAEQAQAVSGDGTITEEVALELNALLLETRGKMEDLEKEYPAVAAQMGKEALKRFSNQIIEEAHLQERAMEMADELMANPGDDFDPMPVILRFFAGELEKLVD